MLSNLQACLLKPEARLYELSGMPIKTRGEPIKFTGMPTKTIGKLIKTIGEAIKFYYFLMRPDSISKTASCVSE